MEQKSFQYPKEVCTSKRPKQTFSVESHLSVARCADGQFPLKTFQTPLSRYKFAIIETEASTSAVSGNIPVGDIEDIIWRTKYAYNKYMEEVMFARAKAPASQQSNLPACYTVQIKSGTFKGKTPAAVLKENSANRSALLDQYRWLKSNLDKYRGNSVQMDAIKEAVTLFDRGELDMNLTDDSAVSAGDVLHIYPAEAESVPKPLLRNKGADGRVEVYEVAIEWDMSKKAPVVIKIKNYRAFVDESDKGRITVKRDTAVEKAEKTFHMTAAEWVNHLREIRDDMTVFEVLHGRETRQDAENTFEYNRTHHA